jgi:hypothetical protein
MRVKAMTVLAVWLAAISPAFAEAFKDYFLGTALDQRWTWVCEDECSGRVNNGLVLNPKSGNRQAVIGTVSKKYSWVAAANQRTCQFTIGDWKITTDSHVSARLFIVGNEAGAQPEAFSDYNKPNVLMAKLDLWQGVFYWNLFVKTDSPQVNVDDDKFKVTWMNVGIIATGRTFGVTLNRDRARLWWKTEQGKKFESESFPIPAHAFSEEGTLYIGVKNNTGETFPPEQTAEISSALFSP